MLSTNRTLLDKCLISWANTLSTELSTCIFGYLGDENVVSLQSVLLQAVRNNNQLTELSLIVNASLSFQYGFNCELM